MSNPHEELMDIVDENDQVVGKAKRADIYANKHRHRIVHVLIFNEKGEMALQLRSKDKDYCPLHWSTAVGGHVQSGETYEQAAIREMQEEAGITTPIQHLFTDIYRDVDRPGLVKYLTTYETRHNGPFPNLGTDEVEAIEFFPMETVRSMVKNGGKFHPELRFIIEQHFSPSV